MQNFPRRRSKYSIFFCFVSELQKHSGTLVPIGTRSSTSHRIHLHLSRILDSLDHIRPLIGYFFRASSRLDRFIPSAVYQGFYISSLESDANDRTHSAYVQLSRGTRFAYKVFTCHLGALFREQLQLRAWKVGTGESVPRPLSRVRRPGKRGAELTQVNAAEPVYSLSREIDGHFSARLHRGYSHSSNTPSRAMRFLEKPKAALILVSKRTIVTSDTTAVLFADFHSDVPSKSTNLFSLSNTIIDILRKITSIVFHPNYLFFNGGEGYARDLTSSFCRSYNFIFCSEVVNE